MCWQLLYRFQVDALHHGDVVVREHPSFAAPWLESAGCENPCPEEARRLIALWSMRAPHRSRSLHRMLIGVDLEHPRSTPHTVERGGGEVADTFSQKEYECAHVQPRKAGPREKVSRPSLTGETSSRVVSRAVRID